ncbi:MAG TPA: PqqD family protein [Gemmatimonadaceae bacterium]|nr:PqqD family protein [Gemmatimonadaceae bacterium]
MTSDISGAMGTPSPDVLVAHLAGEAVLLNLSDKRYYRLNESAAFIWKALERGESREEILASIVNEYDIDAATASDQLSDVVGGLVSKGLLSV